MQEVNGGDFPLILGFVGYQITKDSSQMAMLRNAHGIGQNLGWQKAKSVRFIGEMGLLLLPC